MLNSGERSGDVYSWMLFDCSGIEHHLLGNAGPGGCQWWHAMVHSNATRRELRIGIRALIHITVCIAVTTKALSQATGAATATGKQDPFTTASSGGEQQVAPGYGESVAERLNASGY